MLNIVKQVHSSMKENAKPTNICNTLFIQKDYKTFLKDVQTDLSSKGIDLTIKEIKKFDMFFRKHFIKDTYKINKNTIKELQ